MDNVIKLLALGLLGYLGYKAIAKKTPTLVSPENGLGKGRSRTRRRGL